MKNNDFYITRMPDNRGWFVRVPFDYINTPEKIHKKYFSDAKYGGEIKAKKRARQYRNDFLRKTNQTDLLSLKLLKSSYRYINRVRSKNNSSGVIGVRLITEIKILNSGNVSIYQAWIAQGSIDNKKWKKTFGTEKQGYEQAFKLACKERAKRHGTLIITTSLDKLPCNPCIEYKISK